MTTRRRLIALAGSAATVGLAGCLGTPLAPFSGDDTAPEQNSASGDSATTEDPDDHDEESDVDSSDGDAHDHGVEDTLGHPVSRIEVSMESDENGHHFVPHLVHVDVGGTVTWELETGVHNTVAYHPNNASRLPSSSEQRIPDGVHPWASDVFGYTGETFEMTFEEPGIYDYVCTVSGHGHMSGTDGGHHGSARTHESVGMVGRVVVGEPHLDPDEQPALRPPSAALPDAARLELAEFNVRTHAAFEETDDH